MKVHRRTDFFGRECSDLGVGGFLSCNPNVVRICKSFRNIGRSLIIFVLTRLYKTFYFHNHYYINQHSVMR